jgi:hypothetical protein
MGSASQTVVNRSAPAMQLPLLMGLARRTFWGESSTLARWAERRVGVGVSCVG